MSSTDRFSSPDAATLTDPEHASSADDRDLLRRDNQLAEPLPDAPTFKTEPDPGTRPARSLDDSWALTGALQVPNLPDEAASVPGETGPSTDTQQSASQMHDAAPVARPVVAAGRDPGVAARLAALRALGSKTMQGIGPVPLQKSLRTLAEAEVDSPMSPVDLHAAAQWPSTFEAITAETSSPHQQAPLYLDEPPATLRLSTDTSEVSVAEIDPGASLPMAARVVGQYREERPESLPSAVQIVAPRQLPLRPPTRDDTPGGAVAHEESDWFEPSGPQMVVDAAHIQRTIQQPDYSFTEPSRRGPSDRFGSQRWIAPLFVFAAVSAVVFAVAYFYQSKPQPPAASSIGAVDPRGSGAAIASPEPPRSPAVASDPAVAIEPTPESASPGSADAGTPDLALAARGEAAAGAAPAAGPGGLVDVRFDSTPPGATVMLVDRDRGVTSLIGTAPIRAALDPRGNYDAIFTLEGQATKVVSISEGAQRIAVDFGRATATTGAAPEQSRDRSSGAAASRASDRPASKPIARPAVATAPPVARRTQPVAKKPAGDAQPEPGGDAADDASVGTLSISSKPACEISINGKATGLMTPQRRLPLPAGIHRITLTNKESDISETMAVRVTAGKETKMAQDYTGSP